MGTLDGHLVAIDAAGGRPLWNIRVGDPSLGYSITMAPLAVKNKILVGVAAASTASAASLPPSIRVGQGVVALLHGARTGERGHETWTGDTWRNGGGRCG